MVGPRPSKVVISLGLCAACWVVKNARAAACRSPSCSSGRGAAWSVRDRTAALLARCPRAAAPAAHRRSQRGPDPSADWELPDPWPEPGRGLSGCSAHSASSRAMRWVRPSRRHARLEQGAQLLVGQRLNHGGVQLGRFNPQERVSVDLTLVGQPGCESSDGQLPGSCRGWLSTSVEQVSHPATHGPPLHRRQVLVIAPREICAHPVAVGLEGGRALADGPQGELPGLRQVGQVGSAQGCGHDTQQSLISGLAALCGCSVSGSGDHPGHLTCMYPVQPD